MKSTADNKLLYKFVRVYHRFWVGGSVDAVGVGDGGGGKGVTLAYRLIKNNDHFYASKLDTKP